MQAPNALRGKNQEAQEFYYIYNMTGLYSYLIISKLFIRE
jgi:hypothetical protein